MIILAIPGCGGLQTIPIIIAGIYTSSIFNNTSGEAFFYLYLQNLYFRSQIHFFLFHNRFTVFKFII